MTSRGASLVVFATSALVLVLETIAGRLMAPYVGISLEAFTGIIGTVLAGIATGSAVGGWLADLRDPRPMIGQALIVGGVLTWLTVPIVTSLGPSIGASSVEIVFLTATAFFLPAAVLSAISPMVVKLRLESLTETGAVVGGLSAAGTAGALIGTFTTGFVLVGLWSVRTIVLAIGLVLIVGGLAATWWAGSRPSAVDGVLVVAAGVLLGAVPTNCDYETDYFCARIEVDEARPSGRSLYLDQLRHAYVDLDDPTYLEFRYMRLFATAAESMPAGPLDVLHIGGGGFSFPRYLNAVRPGSTNRVLEIDDSLVDIAEAELGLTEADHLDITIGDARLALDDLPVGGFDLVIGDAFGSESVPWHLTTREVMSRIDRLLRPGGVYVMNVIDGGRSRFARAELATMHEQFDHVAAIVPAGGLPTNDRVNHILIASDRALPRFDIAPEDGQLVADAALLAFVGEARVLTDNFAPVDQLAQ